MPHYPPDATRLTGYASHGRGSPPWGDGCGDAVRSTLACYLSYHASCHAWPRTRSALTALSIWMPCPAQDARKAAPTPATLRYGMPVPSRGNKTHRSAAHARRCCPSICDDDRLLYRAACEHGHQGTDRGRSHRWARSHHTSPRQKVGHFTFWTRTRSMLHFSVVSVSQALH